MNDSGIYTIEMLNRVYAMKSNPDYQAEISGTTATSDFFDTVGDLLTTAKDWEFKLAKSSKQFTIAGVDIKEVVAVNFSVTASAMSAYGVKTGDAQLTGLKTLYTYSNLLRTPIVDLQNDIAVIMGLITANKTPLADYKIDVPYTTNLTTLAAKLDTMAKLPQDVIKQHALDMKQWENHLKTIKKFFDDEMDPFMEIYQVAMVALYLAYLAARKVRHHHLKRKPKVVDPETTTGILELMALFKASMGPAAGASYVVTALGISDTTDEDGEGYNDGCKPGTFHGKIMMEGYKDIEFDFTIEAGKTTALQFLLEAADTAPVVSPK